MYSFMNNRLDKYWIKRIQRVYIPYIVIVFVSFIVPAIHVEGNRIVALLSHVFLFKAFSETYIKSFGNQLWYISTIIELYVVFYWLAKKGYVESRKLLYCSIPLSIVWMTITGIIDPSSKVMYSVFLTFIWVFTIGIRLAEKIMGGV